MSVEPPWRPGPNEQRALWYLQAILRYPIGGGGLVWEAVVDNFRDPIALLVFGAIASATDVFGFARDLIRTAQEEKQAVECAIQAERESSQP